MAHSSYRCRSLWLFIFDVFLQVSGALFLLLYNKSNDNCYVEQKNWDVVRKNLGYTRYDTDEQFKLIQKILPLIVVYQNIFQPPMKLLTKKRDGAKVHKTYMAAKTPLQQLIEHPSTPPELAELIRKLERPYSQWS